MQFEKTHYDTLKVSRDAPVEVIRAAYRVLSQKHHPDRRPEDPAAAAAMGLLNQAYEVLSDPERRRAYDALIRKGRVYSPRAPASEMRTPRPVRTESRRETRSAAAPLVRRASRWRQYGILLGAIAVALAGFVAVLFPARGPQMDAWVTATPPPEDREAYIRRLAREVMLPRGSATADSEPAAAAPGSSPSPANDLPASATGRATPAEPAPAPSEHDAPRPDDVVPPALDPGEEAGSMAGDDGTADALPSTAASTGAEAIPEALPAGHEADQGASELGSGITEDGQPLR